jgi:hypothetical protein
MVVDWFPADDLRRVPPLFYLPPHSCLSSPDLTRAAIAATAALFAAVIRASVFRTVDANLGGRFATDATSKRDSGIVHGG